MRTNKLRLAVGSATLLGSGLVAGTLISGGGALAADPAAPAATAPAAPGHEPHEHTDVTGADLTRVTEAVEAHDATIAVEAVRQDPDGSYDVHGTKDGEPVALDVSADLATVTERPARGPGHRGGPCGDRPGAAPSEEGTTTPSSYVRA